MTLQMLQEVLNLLCGNILVLLCKKWRRADGQTFHVFATDAALVAHASDDASNDKQVCIEDV